MDELTELSATSMRHRQLSWALEGGVPAAALEERRGKASWVLKREYQKLNLFRPAWWDHITGAEHRWARALNSSQCFAVNIFAPLAEDPVRARKALQLLLPTREFAPGDDIAIRFEFTPEGAAAWLGERGQPTQIDVYFGVTRSNRCIGHVLVEVKFTESSFGCCRGWETKIDTPSSNPDLSRCLDSAAIVSAPEANCWLAQSEGRQYWKIMSEPGSSIHATAIRVAGGCPFRHGLYQMMRNRVLADELGRRTGAAWADFAVCRHSDNKRVVVLAEPVLSLLDAVGAFRSLSSNDAILDWDAEKIVRAIASTDDRLDDWRAWMLRRYFSCAKEVER
jgi:hypothetical protein